MYEGIHDDFNVVKKHCKQNGNVTFDENAVFELLENLYPLYGSVQAIQQVIEMLDAQITRDKDISKDKNLEVLNSDKSNDTIDSIIEVSVPKKNHPFIDLTSNSPESDDFQIIEKNDKTVHNKDGNDEDFDLKDLASSSESDDELNFSGSLGKVESKTRNNPFLNYLALIKRRKSNDDFNNEQSISNLGTPPEANEMLEENNNDPNNNLDEGILNEESADIRNSYNDFFQTDSLNDSSSSNFDSNILLKSTSNFTPHCSKDTGDDMQIENKTELTNIYKTTSPIPGCSKDFNNANDFEASWLYDDTIKEDIVCIKEIIPWADSETIYSILSNHKNSSKRKELTLWDLMKNKSNEFDAPTSKKRKQEESISVTSKKILKVEPDYDDSSLDSNALVHLNNMNNSSDCSEFSEVQDFEDDQICQNKYLKPQGAVKKNIISNKIIDTLDETVDKVEFDNCGNAKTNIIPIESDHLNNPSTTTTSQVIFNPYTIRPIKKERNETVVSSSSADWMVKSIDFDRPVIRLMENNKSHKKSSNEQPLIVTDPKSNDTININLEAQGVVEKAKKDMEDAINYHRAVNFTLKNDHDNIENQERKNKASKIILPPKLVVQTNLEKNLKKTLAPASCIRPANFNYINSTSDIKLKPAESKDMASPIPIVSTVTLNENANFQNKTKRVLPPMKPNFFHSIGKPSNHIFNPVSTLTNNLNPQANNYFPRKILVPRERNPSILKEPVLKTNVKKSKSDMEAIEEIKRDIENSCAKFIPLPKLNLPGLQSATITSNHHKELSSAAQSSTTNSNPTSLSSSEEVPDRQIYNKLRSIFPDVQSSYVKQICINPSVIGPYNNKDELLHGLINHLLSEGQKHLGPKENNFDKQQLQCVVSVDEQYEYLAGIFPDADPTFLRNFVEKNLNSEGVIDQFIQDKLEKRDYPTKEQYLAKIKITEQLKQYTSDFKIEKFLELFPDPYKHFEDSSRKCAYQPIAMEFLKSFFNRIKVNTISREYRKNQYNLSLTAKALTFLGSDMKSKRGSSEMPTEDIPLLQEITFIKNKENIRNHIETLRTKEEESFKLLKASNMLVTCQCCFNDECIPTKTAECNEGHVFCFECIIRGSESTLADGEAQIKCFTDCKSEFSLATLQKILPPTQFSVLLKKKQAAEVMAADVEGLVSCPFCHFASIPPPEDKVFKCLNPECMKETCRQCKEINHVPLKCDEVIKTDKARLLIEEKMTEALIRTCYKCKRAFYKEEGCNKMTCTCGALMCYVCDKPIKDYKHFNAQGGENSNLCPLYCDDRLVNAQAVIKVAEECKKALLKNNPNLKLDTDALLPKLPTKTKGPHDDIPNANQLPEHVRRIAGTPQFHL